ncbi:MAG: MFS transporter [Chloroflexi bacterium]|nr:MFS transporter [Chloroflexota bacterium]
MDTRADSEVRKDPTLSTTDQQRWLYALPNLGLIATQQAFGAFALFYYADVKRLPPAWVGLALTAFAIYNAINNPILGYVSDRTRTRWGRRIPYMMFGTIPMAIAFALLWVAPFDGTTQPVALLIYFIAVLVVWDGLYTAMGTIAYYGLLPEMFPSYEARTDVGARMNLFLLIGLLVGLALPPLIYGNDEFWARFSGGLPPAIAPHLGWIVMGVAYAVLATILVHIGLRGMVERPLDDEVDNSPVWDEIGKALTNVNFLSVIGAQTLRFVVTYTLTAGIPFYVQYTLRVDETNSSIILGVVVLSAIPALLIWKAVARAIGPRGTLMAAFAVMAVSVLPLGLPLTVASTSFVGVFIGIGLSGMIYMGDLILTDVVDEDELLTGRRREGIYYGFLGLITTLASAISALLFTWVATRFGYDTALLVQPASVGEGFRFFMTIPPFIGSLAAAGMLMFYQLHGDRLEEVKQQLAAKQSAA